MADPNMTGQGKLVIQTTTARDARPVQGVSVAVSEAGTEEGIPPTLLFTAVTDESGLTPVFDLPAPPRADSQSPGKTRPYARYLVQIEHPDYQPVSVIDVTVFDGVVSTLPVYLLPREESAALRTEAAVIPPPPLM